MHLMRSVTADEYPLNLNGDPPELGLSSRIEAVVLVAIMDVVSHLHPSALLRQPATPTRSPTTDLALLM
jgi:hypothetical protein